MKSPEQLAEELYPLPDAFKDTKLYKRRIQEQRDCFIAGYNSRDGEVEALKAEISRLRSEVYGIANISRNAKNGRP